VRAGVSYPRELKVRRGRAGAGHRGIRDQVAATPLVILERARSLRVDAAAGVAIGQPHQRRGAR
jgi:hypothetical protein